MQSSSMQVEYWCCLTQQFSGHCSTITGGLKITMFTLVRTTRGWRQNLPALPVKTIGLTMTKPI